MFQTKKFLIIDNNNSMIGKPLSEKNGKERSLEAWNDTGQDAIMYIPH